MKLLFIILVLVILVVSIAFWRDIKSMSARHSKRRTLNRQQAIGNRQSNSSIGNRQLAKQPINEQKAKQ